MFFHITMEYKINIYIKVDVDFVFHRDVEKSKIRSLLSERSGESYVITLISEDTLKSSLVVTLVQQLTNLGITIEKLIRLSDEDPDLNCNEIHVRIPVRVDIEEFRRSLLALGKNNDLDIALQQESLVRKHKRLVVMDMDSTVIQQEIIDELAKYAGFEDKIKAITARAMNGELDFQHALEERVALLKGLNANIFQKIIDNLVFTPGVHFLCATLKNLGYKLAVLSGGFTPVLEHTKRVLNLDYVFANQLEIQDGIIMGRTIGPIVDASRKRDLLLTIAQAENISLDQVIAVGDGANDLLMLGVAGVGVAFNAKPKVQEASKYLLNRKRLDAILYLLGINYKDAKLIHNS